MTRVAVVLFNLGGPDSPAAIRPFLKNFFSDPAIIGLPQPFRGVLARYIAWKRGRNEAGSAYARLGGKSPLLENTQAQAGALEGVLNTDPSVRYKVYVCMRYWHPMTDAVVKEVMDYKPDRVVLLPLYPQYSTTTSESSYKVWETEADKAGLTPPASFVCCYPTDTGFVDASADLVRHAYMRMRTAYAHLKPPRILFSAHGLPEKIIKAGDPYQSHCGMTAAAIVRDLGIENTDWLLCYQSRVGPLKWIGPSTEEALRQAAHDNVPVLVYPLAFVSEHVETLVEIEEEYRHLAAELGVPAFERVGTVMTHPLFIDGLANLVRGVTREVYPPCVCVPGAARCGRRIAA